MKAGNKTSSVLLITHAKAAARKGVSKLRCLLLGFCLGFLPKVHILALGIVIFVVYILKPKIDLSTSEQVEIYSQHPALYTEYYRKTAKKVRFMGVFFGWIIGLICLVYFL